MPSIFTRHGNRRITCGPPKDWIDPIPPYKCELLIRNLPIGYKTEVFLSLLKRFGIVYKLRFLVDYTNIPHSVAFVRYTIELDALAAIEMLNRQFLTNGMRVAACKSFTQQSLFIANIPKTISYEIVYEEFLRMFPNMRKLILSNALSLEESDFAVIEFRSYEEALKVFIRFAKKGIQMWDVDLKVAWAQFRPQVVFRSKHTVVIRRINSDRCYFDFLMKLGDYFTRDVVKRMELTECERVIIFRNMTSAIKIYVELEKICAADFTVEHQSLASTQNCLWKPLSDYCAELRMICIANNWRIPIILFGTNYRTNNLQYGAVFLADEKCNFTAIFMEVETTNVSDIQSDMCELVVGVVNKFSGLLNQNVVYRITNRVGYYVCNLNDLMTFTNKDVDRIRDWNSIHKMTLTVRKIFMLSDEEILFTYRGSFLNIFTNADYGLQKVLPSCLPVYPKYRNMHALPFNLNDTEIVLVLRDNTSDKNLPVINSLDEIDINTIHLSPKENSKGYELKYVDAGNVDFYHPSQQINVAPIWIQGHTYRHSIKNFIY